MNLRRWIGMLLGIPILAYVGFTFLATNMPVQAYVFTGIWVGVPMVVYFRSALKASENDDVVWPTEADVIASVCDVLSLFVVLPAAIWAAVLLTFVGIPFRIW